MNASSVGHMTWSNYVESVTADGPTAIAKRIDVTAPSVSRWWGTTQRPRPEQAAAFARAYGRPVLEAFVAAGFLTPREAAERPSAPPSLAALDDDALLVEVRRRMRGGHHEGQLPEDQKTPPGAPASVTHLRTPDPRYDPRIHDRHAANRGVLMDDLDQHPDAD